MEAKYDLYLTDLIQRDTLQKMQDAFARLTGMSVIITDTNGIAVTNGSNFSTLCKNYTRSSPVGCILCAQSNKAGTELALKNGRSTVYPCYSGLMNFASPIMVEERLVGCVIGGQVLTEMPDPEEARKTAEEIGADPETYLAELKKVKIVKQEEIETAAQVLSTMVEILSDMASNKYYVHQAAVDMERTSNMKSDFLANMSHEIRTPMNAVIGMAEMAMREDLPPAARNYIYQIKEAGRSLLTIINDILDFSKIESGKMDINVDEYEPMSVVSDVANIVMTRLKGKDVELILDISPNLPNKLLGDNIRIKQVLLNITNNAAKFTNIGKITLKMDYLQIDEGDIELNISVEDTGIGIKKEDSHKLFQSFQQLDSKRNRNIEGTGLGLAISKQLLNLMDGDIWVESEYEKGSKFSFVLPQKIVDRMPCCSVKNPDSRMAACMIANPHVKENFRKDVETLGVEYRELHFLEELAEAAQSDKKCFLFVEKALFTAEVENFVKENPQMTAVLLVDFFDTVKYEMENLHVIKKPLFVLSIAMLLNEESTQFDAGNMEASDFDFIAPDAQVLIVDDNAVNLTVAEGLLEPLKMHVDTAVSGKEAIEKISQFHYDIVFMDHMMPELDGVETTRIIRRFHQEYNDVPIIALTANAVEGTKEMFCREGMNDFVAKPIELLMLVSKVRQWLPIEKIQKVYMSGTMPKEPKTANIVVGDLDVAFALKFLGTEELFWSVLKVYYKAIEKKAKLIKQLEEEENWTDYTIEVHALKSSSKQIGAITLSDKAAALEKAGNARDAEFIHKNTGRLLEQYLGYRFVFKPFLPDEQKEDGEKDKISAEGLLKHFADMRAALEDLDMDRMEEVVQEMNHYHYEDWQEEMYTRLKDAVEEIDVDSCEEILTEWEKELSAV
ncbi:MAG: PocR ligand-binding domain-containing protein [Blautia sp.]|nr:PocR ligand-binding domain-containing protein [Blautia sp.]MCM1201432.1 PocR ligand-binding domain-containing protein [Bacteroides fragilis]